MLKIFSYRYYTLVLIALVFIPLAKLKSQSPFALGYQWQTYNPKYYPFENEDVYARYSFNDISGFVLEEPGIIFGAISAVYGTEANRIKARNEAIRKRNSSYIYGFAKPPEMPSWRWWRWSYVTGTAKGVEYVTPNGTQFDSEANVTYYRLDFNIVLAPRLLTDWGLYWMPSAALNISETKLNPTVRFSDLWYRSKYAIGPLNTNLLFHLGYQPDFFPWLMVEGNGGVDFIQWGLATLTDAENYKMSYRYGLKASLGSSWLQFYYNWDFIAEGSYGKRTRKTAGSPIEGWSQVRGIMTSYGIRLDVGTLLYDFLDF